MASQLPLPANSSAIQARTFPAEQPVPLVRVVIPAFRSAKTIRDVVSAVLRSQGRFDLQIVVVDDGGHEDLQKSLARLPATILSTGGSGSAAFARNFGAEGFDGDFLVFIDSDVIVDELCIETLLQPLVSGVAEAAVGNYSKNVKNMPFAACYKQLYISRVYERRAGYLLNEFWTAIGAIDARVFHRLQGFDETFMGAGGEDTDLGGRLTKAGFRVVAVPEAFGDHRHQLNLAQLLKNDWRKGLLAMRNHYDSGGSISENRHATRRDTIAAGLSVLVLFLFVLLPLPGFPTLSAIVTLFLSLSAYLASRADILSVFSRQGPSFVVRAIGLMFLLDLMRSACFATGAGLHLIPPITKAAARGHAVNKKVC